MKIDKDTQVCISISSRPGNTGTRIHNALYEKYGLNFIYKSFFTTDPIGALSGVRALGIRGCSVSMPFKQEVIHRLDEVDSGAIAANAVNTILNENQRLTGFNTDIPAAQQVISQLPMTSDAVTIFGAGATARSLAVALCNLGTVSKIRICNRTHFGATVLSRIITEMGLQAEIITTLEEDDSTLLINATPIGMNSEDIFPITNEVLRGYSGVFDVVIGEQTNLIGRCNALNIPCVAGKQMTINQALHQFEIYTGIKPDFDNDTQLLEKLI
jgi:shikimate dehydrogenase